MLAKKELRGSRSAQDISKREQTQLMVVELALAVKVKKR